MHGRWVVVDLTDMCKSSDFLHVLDMADKLTVWLNKFSNDLAMQPGWAVPSSLRQEATQLLICFTTIRSQFVDTLVTKTLRVPGLQTLHKERQRWWRRWSRQQLLLGPVSPSRAE